MGSEELASQRSGLGRSLFVLLRTIALTLLVLLVLAAGTIVFLLSPVGLPVVLAQAKSLMADSGTTLTTTGESGSLYSGVSFESLSWTDDATSISANRIRSNWSLISLFRQQLVVSEFSADRLEVRLPPAASDPPPREAIVLPPSLTLPVDINFQRAQVRELTVTTALQPPEDALVFRDLGFSFAYQNGTYTLGNLAIDSPWGNVVEGRLDLGDTQPYPVTANLPARGEVAPIEFETDVRVFGDLDRLRVSISGSAAGSPLSAQATLKPLTLAPVSAASLRFSSLETARFSPNAPEALLDVSLRLRTDLDPEIPAGRWRIAADILNTDAGLLFENRLPLESASAVFELVDPTAQALADIQVNQLTASLRASQGSAVITGDGSINLAEQIEVVGRPFPVVLASLAVERFDLASFAGPDLQTRLSGTVKLSRDRFDVDLNQVPTQVSASGAAGTVIMDALSARKARIELRGLLSDQAVSLDEAAIVVGETRLSVNGAMQIAAPYALTADARIESFRPDQWIPKHIAIDQRWRDGLINAQLSASGLLKPGPSLQLGLDLDGSQLAGQALSGKFEALISLNEQGRVELIRNLDTTLVFGKNEFTARGALLNTVDKSAVEFALKLNQMSAFHAQIAGRTALSGSVKGAIDELTLSLKGSARRLRIKPSQGPVTSLGSVTIDALVPFRIASEPDASFVIDLRARDLRRANERIVRLGAKIDGTLSRHRLDVSLNRSGQNTSIRAIGAADLAEQASWRGMIDSIRSDGRLRIRSAEKAQLLVTTESLDLSNLVLAISGSGIARSISSLDRLMLNFGENTGAQVLGRVQAMPVAQLISAFRSQPLPATLNNLRLSSAFDLSGSGIDDLTGVLTATLSEQGDRNDRLGLAGQNEARFSFDQGAIDGDIDLTLPSLSFSRRFTGPSWVIDGMATLAGTVGGRLSAPTYQVRLSISELSLLQPALGWQLDRGRLLADISDRGLLLRSLRLQTGDEGIVELAGRADVLNRKDLPRLPDGTQPVLPLDGRFELDANQFIVPIGPGQQLVLSGKTQLLAERGRLRWVGNLAADEGLIEIAGSGAPTLPDDVQIIAEEPARPTPKPAAEAVEEQGQLAIETGLEIDLGNRLRIVGGGINARLTGQLTLLGTLPASPRAEGLVEIKDGTYQAYSQDLRIRRGDVRFNGPIDNPALNIEAVRPNLPITAGISITGLALSPRIDLFSDPAMTDAETLSWLVLGVPIDNAQSGAQSLALKEAASRIIGQDDGSVSGGSFSDKLGLDTLGFGFASDTGQAQGVRDSGAPIGLPGAGGQTSASTYQEVVTLGKKLSDRLTVSYEQGVRGLFNLLRIQYEINQRLSLRAQTGSENAVDLLYFWSFD